MEWEFSPEQVVKATVDYGFDDFRLDLYREVRMNAGSDDPARLQTYFDLLFDLCHWLATGRRLEDFVAQYRHSPPTCEFLLAVGEAMRPNAEMLGAILQRMIMDGIAAGEALDQSLARVEGLVAEKTRTPVAA